MMQEACLAVLRITVVMIRSSQYGKRGKGNGETPAQVETPQQGGLTVRPR